MGAANNPPTDKESFARDAMHRWVRHQQRTVVLHLTDLDPNGWGISKALEKDLEAFIETNGWFDGFNPLVEVFFRFVAMETRILHGSQKFE